MRERVTPGIAVGLVLGVSLAACSAGPKPDVVVTRSAAPPTAIASSAAPAPFGMAALTGAAATSDSMAKRPALAVAITIAKGAPAPVGLDKADVIIEEIGATNQHRLVAIYQSQDATKIGPIGEARPMDTRLLAQLHPVIANNGEPPQFAKSVGNVKNAINHSYDTDAAAYTKEGAALYTSTAAQYKGVTGTAPPELFLRRTDTLRMVTEGDKPTTKITVTVPGEAPVVWTDDVSKRAFVRTSPSITAANLVIMKMPYRTEKISKKSSATVRTAEVTGNGECVVATDGFAAPCTWKRDGAAKFTLLLDSKGYPARLSAGNTWIMYVPPGSNISWE